MAKRCQRVGVKGAPPSSRGDWAGIERRLQVLAEDDEYRLSWSETAAALSFDPSQLHARFPKLAADIARKARDSRARKSAARREDRLTVLRLHVQQLVLQSMESGIEPTRRRVEAELRKRGIDYRWADYPLIAEARHEARAAKVGRQNKA